MPGTVTDKDSVLISTKKILGIAAEYTAFDLDILIHINGVISTLHQLGVGLTDDQYEVEDENDTWMDVLTTQKNLVMIKSYIYLRVRQLFDPPATGFVTTSFAEQIKELEWRIMVAASSTPNIPASESGGDSGGGTIDPDDVADAVDAYLEANPVADGVVITQSTPLSTWTLPHSLHRVPVVAVYIDGEEVDADVEASDTQVIVMFPTPTAGFAVLT